MAFSLHTRFAASLSCDVTDVRNRIETIRNEAMETCRLGKWAGLIQIMALSSVLRHAIFSVYPNYSLGIRPLLHGLIVPRYDDPDIPRCTTFYIMWTRCGNFDNRKGTVFEPNHFVPLLQLGFNIENEQEFPSLGYGSPGTACSQNACPLSRGIVKRSLPTQSPSPVPKRKHPKVSKFLNNQPSCKQGNPSSQTVQRCAKSATWYRNQPSLSTKDRCTTLFSPASTNGGHKRSAVQKEICRLQKIEGKDFVSCPSSKKRRENVTKQSSGDEATIQIKFRETGHGDTLPFPSLSQKWYNNQSLQKEVNSQSHMYTISSSTETTETGTKLYESKPNPVLLSPTTKNDEKAECKVKKEQNSTYQSSKAGGQKQKETKQTLGPLTIGHCAKEAVRNDSRKKAGEGVLPFTILSRNWYGKQATSYKSPSKDQGRNEQSTVLPLNSMSSSWYRRRGQLAQKNVNRTKQVGDVKGSLTENITTLENENSVHDCNVKAGTWKTRNKMISVGKYILRHGPFVPTQEVGKLLTEDDIGKKNPDQNRRPMSSEIYAKVRRYLNVIQIYIKGKAYLLENKNYDLSEVARRLENICTYSLKNDINKHVTTNVGELLNTAIRFADTKRDADLIKGLFAKITSVKQVAKMLDVQNRSSIRVAEQQLNNKLREFQNIECTSQIVRNDMSNEQQRRLTKIIIGQRKQRIFKLEFETRGRALKADLFPELKMVLEEIFNYGDNGMIGGLESHPRLTTDIMYRSRDNNLFMRQAREILLKVAPPDFGISLKTCYNYTESYKEKTHSAQRHHAGKGINARICLKRPPRTSVSKQVVNLHWTTKNVNLLLESAANNLSDSLVDSKDAKAIICGDIQPVQIPGKSWKPITYPDHTFDQSRTNAVYPMAHLFLDNTCCSRNMSKEDSSILEITRTGRPVLLINIALYEPETTFRAMNELLYLLSHPSLDDVFRNSKTGGLKSSFAFLVDNGHGEDPDSPLTQMCLARILNMFNLSKISQRSFAEYHSKRNFVERVHASANTALSRHGSFNSKQIHANAQPDSKEHQENMEKMAQDVKACLSEARFAEKFLKCFRGIGESGVFTDEERLKEFLNLSEERKEECDWRYSVNDVNNPCFQALVHVWGVPEDFEILYIEDFNVIMNKTGKRTAWKDKYSTNLYGNDNKENFELQQIPDYVSWLTSGGELHYLSYEKTCRLLLSSPVLHESPELFLPSRILDNLFTVQSYPPDDIIRSIAILSWIPVDEVATYFANKREKAEKDYQQDILRERWSRHDLYKKNVVDLQHMCKTNGLSAKGNKHELVRRLALHRGEQEDDNFEPVFSNINSLPENITDIRKLPIATIKYILKMNAMSICGRRDDLILRLFLLRHGRSHLCSFKEIRIIQERINMSQKLISEQLKDYLLTTKEIKKVRAYRSVIKEKSQISIPENVETISDLHQIFEPLLSYLNHRMQVQKVSDETINQDFKDIGENGSTYVETNINRIFYVGTRIRVRWTKEEIGDSGWRAGWYVAEVQTADTMLDQIEVVYLSEPDSIYQIDVTSMLAEGKLQLAPTKP